MIRLFTSFYPEPDRHRSQEIVECLRRNLAQECIHELCVLLENVSTPFCDDKLFTRSLTQRPLYEDLFSWASELQRDGDLAVICNSDIYFDRSLVALQSLMKPEQCAALSRWHVHSNGEAKLFDRADSQDAWAFRGPLKSIDASYPIGVARCDNRMMYQLRRAGYDVINPAFSVRSFHLHAADERPYDYDSPDMVEGPYNYHWPHNLLGLLATIRHNIKSPEGKLGWRFDRRWFAGTLPIRMITKPFRMITKPFRTLFPRKQDTGD